MDDQPNTPPVEIAFRTDPGRDPDKVVNEDSALHVEARLGLLAVVCDGMGGHAGGKEASELAVATIAEIVQAAPSATLPRDAVRVAIEEANRRVWSMVTNEGGYRPGSTVVAVLAHSGGAEIAHVGDSRVYLIHAGAITQITRDHSMVQELVDHKLIKPEDAATHPEANKILRALGIAKGVEVTVRPEPVAYVAGDVFVLCSDGLSDLVGPAEILDIAGSRPAAQAAGQLVDLANARGGHDNITAMVLRMKGSAMASEAPTILKTMPLTAHEMPAPEQVAIPAPDAAPRAGPHGTVLTAPLPASFSGTAAMSSSTSAAPVKGQLGMSSPPPSSARGIRSKVTLVFGVLLGLLAVGAGGIALWQQQRPRHVNVPIVPTDAALSPPPEDDAAAVAAPEVTLAPVLAPPSGVKVPWWKDPDAAAPSGEPPDCVRARWQKEHGRPAASYEPLEAKCRAAGGKP